MFEFSATSREVFRARIERLRSRLYRAGGMPPCIISAGWARPRNFGHSHFPFRAESHFLHLVGHHIEGGLLCIDGDTVALYLEPPDPEVALWVGETRGLDEWAELLEISVLPLAELAVDDCAVVPPPDEDTAIWLSGLLDREVEAQGGSSLEGADRVLAQALIEERLIKDDAALAQMSAVARVSAEAHRHGIQAVVRGACSESQVRAAIEGHFCGQGLDNAYNSIVTIHGEILHAERSSLPLRPGDLLLCDVGAESPEGYAADITRTWPASGRFSPTQRDLYQAVLDVQKGAISSLHAGVHFAEVHRQSMRAMGQALLDLGILKGNAEAAVERGAVSVFFPHGLGHLLGLDVHDMEDLGDAAGYDRESSRSNDPILRYLRLSRVLRANMVVTIEPGFYQIPILLKRARQDAAVSDVIDWNQLERFSDVRGIRIEDDVVIRQDAPWVLSEDAPKEIAQIESYWS